MLYTTVKTRVLLPTETRDKQVKATYAGQTLTVSWDHSMDAPEMHEYATRKLVESVEGKPVRLIQASHDEWGYTFRVTDAGSQK